MTAPTSASPGIDPLISWSRYLDQLAGWYRRNIEPDWVEKVKSLQALLSAGDGIQQMMEVTGEEGVTTADYVTYQKALFLDRVFLQQDAFDEVDASTPLQRQHETLIRRVWFPCWAFPPISDIRSCEDIT
jgi:V/A-type H+-transporting ATPase subunit A